MLARLKGWARALKRDVLALWLAARDPRTPMGARVLAMAVAAYAFSPIDLIPDAIPVLGLVDDLLIVPLGIWAALRLIPPELIMEFRGHAAEVTQKPVSRSAAAVIVTLWLIVIAAALYPLIN